MATRIRTKGSRIPDSGFTAISGSKAIISGSFQNPKNNWTYSAGQYPISDGFGSYSDNRASITDETGPAGGIKNVTNTQVSVSSNAAVASYGLENPQFPFGKLQVTRVGSLAPYYQAQVMDYYPHMGIPDGASVALSRVPTTTDEVLSGLNSGYELREVRALIDQAIPAHFLWAAARAVRQRSYRSLVDWLAEIKQQARSPLGLLQALVGADLMWKFGIRPLMADINAVHNYVRTFDSKMNELFSKEFTVKGKHTETRRERIVHVSGDAIDTLGCHSEVCSTYRETTKTWVYGVSKRLDPTKLPSIDPLALQYLTDKLGLSLEPKDLWAAAPQSFVVDWFIPIDTFLEQFDRVQPDPTWLVTTGCWSSVKTSTTGYTEARITPLTNSNCVLTNSSGLIDRVTYSKTDYQRTRLTTLPGGIPNIYIPSLSLPNLGQGVTGIEMLISRIKRTLK